MSEIKFLIFQPKPAEFHLHGQQFHPCTCSCQNLRAILHFFLFYFTSVSPFYQRSTALPVKYIQNLITSHHLHVYHLLQPSSSWITAVASLPADVLPHLPLHSLVSTVAPLKSKLDHVTPSAQKFPIGFLKAKSLQ